MLYTKNPDQEMTTILEDTINVCNLVNKTYNRYVVGAVGLTFFTIISFVDIFYVLTHKGDFRKND